MDDFVPFADEAAVLDLEGLVLENRTDRVEMYGSVQFTLDQEGCRRLDRLLAVLGEVRRAMGEAKKLPDRVPTLPPGEGCNPDPMDAL